METEIYTDNRIRVTTARIIIGGTTYALRNITSVGNATTAPDTGAPKSLVTFSLLGLMAGIIWIILDHADSIKPALILSVVSLAILVMSAKWYRDLKPTYHLMITSSAQEADALRNTYW
jgi:hypothetical protein